MPMRLIRHGTRLLVAILLACGMVVTVGSGPALACSCAMAETPDFVSWSDDIVAGTLLDIREPRGLVMSSADPNVYTVDVDAVFKGDAGRRVVFESAMSGASCGLEGMVADQRYVFFLSHDGDTRSASLCGGTAPASVGLLAEVEAVTGPPWPPAGADDPLPAADLTGWLFGAVGAGVALVAGVAFWVLGRGRAD
jgi:hypothetical protein